ncbi:MAG TPA: diaminopimelate epimerase [Steroidobacter sp.]|jgi:diaminopimelate epimerase|nr:diaminopimelate epimerase [Steroidobacter sp.]
MQLRFTKMHGLGNDFIVFETPEAARIPGPEMIRRLADRRTGIGFDQALVLLPPRSAHTDVFYRIFNADGSEVEQCGNGARCIASLVADKLCKRAVRMGSPGGEIAGRVLDDGAVSLDMGAPDFDPRSLPFEAASPADIYPLLVGDREIQISAVSMGNPHAVLRTASVRDAPVDTLGPAIENHPRFPKRTNVGFMEIVDRAHIRLRVFERGAGETQACGTGACAAAAVGRKLGLLDEEVQVDAPGGRMSVRWAGPGRPLWLTGPAVKVYEGTVEVPVD